MGRGKYARMPVLRDYKGKGKQRNCEVTKEKNYEEEELA